jgi:hypothetical protein
LSTILDEIKKRAAVLIQTIGKDQSGSGSYSSACQGDNKPIVIASEEIEDYESFGRKVNTLEFQNQKYNFVCLNTKTPHVYKRSS